MTVFADVIASVAKIRVEHSFEFDPHNIAPTRCLGKVEHIRLWHALHLRVCQPLAVVLIRSFLQAERAVDKEVLVFHVASLARNLVALFHTVEVAILHVDVIYISDTVEGNDEYAILTFVASDILDVDIAHGRSETTAADFLGFVVKINFENRFSALSHLDVAGIDILDDTASTSVGLYADNTVEVGTIHLAVLSKEIAASTGNLTTDNHTTMAILHLAVANDDILARFVPKATVVVSSALHCDTVVASVEEAVLDEHSVA